MDDVKIREELASEFCPCQKCSTGEHLECVNGTPGGGGCDCSDFGHYGNVIDKYVDVRMGRYVNYASKVGAWTVVWNGAVCSPTFRSKGAAEAYFDMLKRGDRAPEYPSPRRG